MPTAVGEPNRLTCTVNGSPIQVAIAEEELTLLDVLRDKLGLTSPKNGCQPQAQCGCCTVLLTQQVE